jgi:alkanesulfonate monooxygenase
MSLEIFWRYGGDNRHPPEQLARAVDHLGYTGYLLAISGGGADMWTTAASLAHHTYRTKFLIAAYSGVTAPLLLASQAATLDRITGGRVAINVISGETRIAHANGLFLDHDERYALADEYWAVWRRLFSGEAVDFDGKYIRTKSALLNVEPVQKPHPPLYFGGSSDAGLVVAAKHVQTYLSWGEPVPDVAEKVARVRALAAGHGRTLRAGVRLHLIVRDTDEEAWAATQKIYDTFDKAQIETALKVRATSDSTGVRRTTELVQGRIGPNARDLEVAPNLWAGYALTGKGPGTALVGSPETVAERLHEYINQAGIDTFILSGQPHLEEAYRVAEQVFPLLPFEVEKSRVSRENNRALKNLLAASAV